MLVISDRRSNASTATTSVNVHLSHYVATNQGDVSRVRTGFEKVVAHRTNPPFAYCADEDGTVEKIDENKGIMTVRYKSGKVVAMDCGELYTSNSSNGFYCTNKLTVNNLKVGSKFKQGAVLVYNREFFEADPMSDQVNWKIGRYANVAVIPCGITIEDSSAMSRQLADDLTFNPCHIRDVVLKKNTTVHEHVKPGSQVVNTDPIIVFDESDMSDSSFGSVDTETAKMLAKLNRRTPTAHYTGEVVRIDVFYACEKSSMSKSIRAMVEEVESVARAKRTLAGKAENATDYPTDLQIKTEGTRIGLTEIDQETVMFRFYIKQTLAVDGGDKVEFDSSLKSVVNEVIDGGWDVEDKSVHIDALFSAIGISNRIINSPIIVGIGTRIAEQLEREILDIWK